MRPQYPTAETFTYKAKRGAEDTPLIHFNLISSHLDTSRTTIRAPIVWISRQSLILFNPMFFTQQLLNITVD